MSVVDNHARDLKLSTKMPECLGAYPRVFDSNCMSSFLSFALNREARTFFRAGLFFKRDSFPDNCIDWTNGNVSFWSTKL